MLMLGRMGSALTTGNSGAGAVDICVPRPTARMRACPHALLDPRSLGAAVGFNGAMCHSHRADRRLCAWRVSPTAALAGTTW